MITPRRRKQCEREETSVENFTKTFTNQDELETPPTPLKSPNHRARRRPRSFGTGQQTISHLFSYSGRANLDFNENEKLEENQLYKNTPRSNYKPRWVQEQIDESENGSNPQGKVIDCFPKPVLDRSNMREMSCTVESSKPPLFPSSPNAAIEKSHIGDCIIRNHNLAARRDEDDWMRDEGFQELCSPVTEQKKCQADVMNDYNYATPSVLEINTPKGCERVLTCPYCNKKWKEESRIRFSPSIRRCSLCSPIRTLTNPVPCNMNPFSPEARSQSFGSPQEDNSSDMPTGSISCCSNVSKSLAFDSTSLLMSHSDSLVPSDEQESDSGEEDHFSFSALSMGRLSCYKEDFEEIEEIGSGTFGKVFKCRQRLDGWLYAVKSSRRKIRNQAEMQNVLREVYALAAMTDNPYVVRYFTAWIEDDILYIQTELCEGGSVMSLWKNGTLVFDTEKMREFIYQVASGLAIYHEKGLVHLDIKPENIYRTSNGTYKIGDLGLTALAEDTIVQGYRIDLSEGDSRYIAPELLEENYQYLTKADIYSLGMTAYELCRQSHLPLPSGGEEWHQIRRCLLEPMTVSTEVASLIREMLCPDPSLRPCAREIIRLVALEDTKDVKIAQLEQQLEQERQRCKALEAAVSTFL